MYDYYAAIREDCEQAIRDNYTVEEIAESIFSDRDEFAEKLNDEFWIDDSVTGNASGSYYCNAHKAAESLMFNLDLLTEAVDEFGGNMDVLKNGAEACDVTIRCYLLWYGIDKALEDLEEDEEISALIEKLEEAESASEED